MTVPRPRCLLVTPLAQVGWPGPGTTFPRPAAINVNYDGKSPNNPQILPPAKHILIVLGWAGLGSEASFYLLINKAGRQEQLTGIAAATVALMYKYFYIWTKQQIYFLCQLFLLLLCKS